MEIRLFYELASQSKLGSKEAVKSRSFIYSVAFMWWPPRRNRSSTETIRLARSLKIRTNDSSWMLQTDLILYLYFRGTSGIDIDLRRVDIDQCPLPEDSTQLNIFAASDKCKKRTTEVSSGFSNLNQVFKH